MKLRITVKVLNWVDWIVAWPVVWYRKRKCGYAYRRIALTEGEWTIVEPADYYRYKHIKWFTKGNGKSFYAFTSIKTGPYQTEIRSLHRMMMEPPEGLVVDHRNNDGLDNRRENLRVVTRSQNQQNRRKRKTGTTSKYLGVHLRKQNKRKRWLAKIKFEKKIWYLGAYENEEEAARAYDLAAKKYYGEFARVNFEGLTAESAENAEKK